MAERKPIALDAVVALAVALAQGRRGQGNGLTKDAAAPDGALGGGFDVARRSVSSRPPQLNRVVPRTAGLGEDSRAEAETVLPT